jgi:[acyl-carrier-protein] S-malonyltransferase/trans-AT polyketide synthase/acyltransferase/oxidoreductase domain-containing protein
MAGIGIVFPGQGSQKAGMGKDFYDEFAAARECFARASDAIGVDLCALCFEEDERLNLTEFTQPAILTTEIAMLAVLRGELGLVPTCFGGHSLGEYTALCAAGVMTLEVAACIVRKRGALMQRAVPAGEGAMAALAARGVAGRDLAGVLGDLEVDVANRNSVDQVVLSGAAAAVTEASARGAALLADLPHRIVPLNVSAPFHSRLMRGIETEFRGVLDEVAGGFDAARAAAVTSNHSGAFHDGTLASLLDRLTRQISGTVDWIANMDALTARADAMYEIGPNPPLRAFFRAAGRTIASITSVPSARKALASQAS